MPASLPVPSKGALRALRNLALGTSCTVAISTGLLTEDRRRRINTAREVHNNAKKLKSARRYHSAGGVTIETFEEHALKYRDEAFWLPSNVLRDTEAALRSEGRGIDKFDGSILPPNDISPSIASPQARVPKEPAIEQPEPSNVQIEIPSDLAIRLNEAQLDIVEATTRFLEVLDSSLAVNKATLDDDTIETAIRLYGACRKQDRLDLCDSLFETVLAHGPITESQFHSFAPEDLIGRLLNRRRPGSTKLEPAEFRRASSIYLTKFKNQAEVLSESMFSLGHRLCSEAVELKLDSFVPRLFFRMVASRGDRPVKAVHHLITAARRQRLHKDVFRYFQNYYIQTFPTQEEFDEICMITVDSTLELQRLDLAEQVLMSASQMAQDQALVMSCLVMIKLLERDFRSQRDIGGTRALFGRLETLLPNTPYPHSVYARIIQYCIEARDNDAAIFYRDQLQQSYGPSKEDGRIHAHFALSKAYAGDWLGVVELFTKAQNASFNDVEMLSSRFVPILTEYERSHSLTEVEDYISSFAAQFALKMDLPLMNFMVEAYGKAGELGCMVRWIDCAVADGCAVDAKTINIILKNCHYRWKFSFEQVYRIYRLIRKEGDNSSNLINTHTVALLRRIAIASARNPAEEMERLKRFDKHSSNQDGIYRSLCTAFSNNDFATTLGIYKRAQTREAHLEYRHFVIAVKASLRLQDNIQETVEIIKEARRGGLDVKHAISAVFIDQVTRWSEESLSMDRLMDSCYSTIAAFENSGTEIPLHVVTHTASALQQGRMNRQAIDLWNSLSSRLKIAPSSFDLASITSLLMAYIGLQDPAGVRWAVHMLSANKIFPDRQFKLALNNARRKTNRMLESQPCSNQVHEFLESLLEGLEKVKAMRLNATEEKDRVNMKTIMIIEKAIDDQKARDRGQGRSVVESPNVQQLVKMKTPENSSESEMAVWADGIEMIHDVDIDSAKLASC
ncbi:uncharacterized protein LY89DRAFT_620853 [Mollisia scopiformis]|uniref:Pentatricopeptide repeat protein n=1 Tax=Mollisia scopiformis TaxID=149040 RepID=A0A194X2I2_MOLSC|nr:uncharacterized protein LY89DRAFT_620853 [Mollisia scopiformis]KUJ14405.1 hypothetical protein LY89DRAFT_620853 [Mollisia scopiformis]